MTFSRWTSTTRCVPYRPSPSRSPASMVKSHVNNRQIRTRPLNWNQYATRPHSYPNNSRLWTLPQCFLWTALITNGASFNETVTAGMRYLHGRVAHSRCKKHNWFHIIVLSRMICHRTDSLFLYQWITVNHRQTHITLKSSIDWRVVDFFQRIMCTPWRCRCFKIILTL